MYNIKFIETKPLIYNNGWLSGYIDSKGLLNLDLTSNQIILSLYNNNNYLLKPLIELYNGRIIFSKSKNSFEYQIFKKTRII